MVKIGYGELLVMAVCFGKSVRDSLLLLPVLCTDQDDSSVDIHKIGSGNMYIVLVAGNHKVNTVNKGKLLTKDKIFVHSLANSFLFASRFSTLKKWNITLHSGNKAC